MSITYTVNYRVHGNTVWIPGGSTVATTFTVPNLTPNQLYDFQIQAVNAAGSSFSNIATASTLSGLTINSITLSTQSFIAGQQAGTPVATISVGMSSGSFTGNFQPLSGPDAAFFQIVGNVLQLAVGNTTVRNNYNITITAQQSGVDNSPFPQSFTLSGTAANAESSEGFAVTAPGTSIYASTTMGSAQSTGPWDKFDLTAGQQVTLLAPGQSLITTTSSGVVKLIYSHHFCYQVNNSVPAGWWYWNTTAAFGPSNWVEYGVNVLTVTPQTYTTGAAIGTQVATISVTMKDGNSFTPNGVLSVSDPTNSFKIVGLTIQAAKILNLTSYPNVTVTATPSVTTDGNSTPLGEIATQTVTIGQTVLVPLGAYITTTFTTTGSNYYANDAAHWTGFVTAMGRTPSIIGAVGSNSSQDPSSWPAIAQFNINNWPSSAPTNLAVLLHWLWQDASGSTIYANVANDTSYAGTPISSWVNQSLDVYRTNGRTLVYIRPSWEWNTNFTGNGINSGTVATFLACWRKFANTVHTYNANNPGFRCKTVWCPALDGGNNGLTLAAQFPSPDGSAVSGKYVDVVAPDTYSFGVPFVSDTTTDTTKFIYTSCVTLAQNNGCTIGASELGGNVSNSGGSPASWIADAVSYWRTIGTTIPIEYLCLWDVNTTPGELEFTNPSSINYPISVNSWKAGVTAGGATPILTLPAP